MSMVILNLCSNARCDTAREDGINYLSRIVPIHYRQQVLRFSLTHCAGCIVHNNIKILYSITLQSI